VLGHPPDTGKEETAPSEAENMALIRIFICHWRLKVRVTSWLSKQNVISICNVLGYPPDTGKEETAPSEAENMAFIRIFFCHW